MEDPTCKRKCVGKDGKDEWVSVWGIRRCNSATCGGFCRWNRDHNAAINIRANLLHYAANGAWPQHATGHRTMTAAATATNTTTIVTITVNAVATA